MLLPSFERSAALRKLPSNARGYLLPSATGRERRKEGERSEGASRGKNETAKETSAHRRGCCTREGDEEKERHFMKRAVRASAA